MSYTLIILPTDTITAVLLLLFAMKNITEINIISLCSNGLNKIEICIKICDMSLTEFNK